MQITERQALELLGECFGVPANDLHRDRTRESIPGWDSMGALMFMAELDERFRVELTAETSRAMTKVADALAFLDSHGLLVND